jgi:hypothetical protein
VASSSYFRPNKGDNSPIIDLLHTQSSFFSRLCLRGTSAVPLEPTNEGEPQQTINSGVKFLFLFFYWLLSYVGTISKQLYQKWQILGKVQT